MVKVELTLCVNAIKEARKHEDKCRCSSGVSSRWSWVVIVMLQLLCVWVNRIGCWVALYSVQLTTVKRKKYTSLTWIAHLIHNDSLIRFWVQLADVTLTRQAWKTSKVGMCCNLHIYGIIECNMDGVFKVSKRNFTMFHQNIRGLTINKIDHIFAYLHTSPVHVLCMSEHHLDMTEIETIRLHNYNLRAKFCRNKFKKGGVCIFTHDSIQCSEINLNKFCKEKDFEICAIELHLQFYKICIVTIYRSPSGDFQYFVNSLEKKF